MQLTGRELALHVQGDDMNLLHTELRQLCLDLLEGETAKAFLSLKAEEDAKQFRVTRGLQPSGVLQEQAAARSGEALQQIDRGGQNETAKP